ncbi:hypothetical protein [Pseudomonas sp. EA_5y_Pfl2_R50]|uniref:hypothetical protein n=1 Tax=Pseudomonas sp. EA_5y_Pfl2_R50 TaxID=3088691 RepID=UPI0030D71501
MSTDKKNKAGKLVKQLENKILPIAGLIPGLKDVADVAKRLIELLEEKKNERIELFCQELMICNETAETNKNFDNAGYEIEFGDLLQACMNDSDSGKAKAYAQLTISLRYGELDRETRRHFVLALKQLTFGDIELLRYAEIASEHEVMPQHGNTVLSQGNIFNVKNMSPIQALSINTLQQLGLTSGRGITQLGQAFTRAIYRKDSLTPDSMNLNVWQSPPIALLSTATKNKLHNEIIDEFRKIRVRCNKINIEDFSPEKQNLPQYKAIVLCGTYDNAIYSHTQAVARYNNDHHYQFVSLGFKFPHRHEISLRISLHQPGNLQEKVMKASKEFGFITDPLS